MRQAIAWAIHHAGHRTVFQKRLIDQPLMAQVLADMVLDVEAATALAFRLARAFDGGEDASEASYRRLMTPVTKYWVCKTAPALVRIKALLAECARDQRAARSLVEQLALAEAGALLLRHAPEAVSDGFIATRLGGTWRHTYGAGFRRVDTAGLVARAAPRFA